MPRPGVAQDGRNVVMVHRRTAVSYRPAGFGDKSIASADTSTELDESPSIAPNGSMVLYATKYAGRGILAAVSVDGGV